MVVEKLLCDEASYVTGVSSFIFSACVLLFHRGTVSRISEKSDVTGQCRTIGARADGPAAAASLVKGPSDIRRHAGYCWPASRNSARRC